MGPEPPRRPQISYQLTGGETEARRGTASQGHTSTSSCPSVLVAPTPLEQRPPPRCPDLP